MSAIGVQPKASTAQLDAFLASVEKQAFVMAKFATGDPDAALDIVQDAMFKLVRQYGSKPAEEWRPLFFRILNNRITGQHRKRGFVQRMSRWFGVDAENNDASRQWISCRVRCSCPKSLCTPKEWKQPYAKLISVCRGSSNRLLVCGNGKA